MCSHKNLKIITIPVCFYQSHFAFFSFARHTMLHTKNAFIILAMYMFKDVVIIHLTGVRLVATGVISYLQITDLIPCSVDIVDNVTLIALHVIHIKKEFT